MNNPSVSPDHWARLAGIGYLLPLASAMFTEFYVKSVLLVSGDGAATLDKIAARPDLWRLGVLADVLTYAGVVLLIAALYTLLKPVNAPLARLAAGWRLIEVAVMFGSTLVGLQLLHLASLPADGSAEALRADLALAVARTQASIFWLGLALLGLGSGLFNWLLLRSGYVPRALGVCRT